MISIREACKADIPSLYDLYDALNKKDDGYFESALAADTHIYMASYDSEDCGFCLLNFSPRYSLYRRLSIPEIQDLNVLESFRRKGIATSLIKYCEGIARSKGCDALGISVGLTKDYGPAQILYANLGFAPDGFGVTYDREAVEKGQAYRVDDDLALMLVKTL
jgi:GNAT superfamily N-acetyltransferase